MGQKYAAYDATGAITGYYDDSINPASQIPARSIEIADDQWQACIENPGYTVVNGVLVAPKPPTAAQQVAMVQSAVWEKIKVERDRRKAGGVKVDTHWFHSDADSRIQQIGLYMFGASVPPVQWKTMSGEFVPMTQTLADQIFKAVAASDQAIFAKAEEHKVAMLASADPANYDFSVGWPLIYGE